MSHKIMIVDDETDYLEVMGKFFRRRKVDFESATSCMEALDLLGKGCFDVVIMDVSMPGKDGLACMAEMKTVQPELEVIILTGHGSLNTGLLGMRQGAFDYCLKPVDFDELLEKITLAREKAATRGHG
ncbi:response regulator [Desulfopila aestuarii]|uniref:Response regulator receiver domain-containing protein n=1 Tax=Desulfopila aestuarii DSM 18488 TaxID=1121416 RepID=A0A1M7Y7B7_9BACT|nr:response regulator [Desulfopila aestuarii]SHO48537.1 Response regulator receiver domain-containing protein [Desulfopila aestuarii DSM 18488]